MSVDAATVRRIAHLARIAVADAEVEHLKDELNAMLAFVEQLAEVDVAGVEPMTSVTPMAMQMRASGPARRGRWKASRSRSRICSAPTGCARRPARTFSTISFRPTSRP